MSNEPARTVSKESLPSGAGDASDVSQAFGKRVKEARESLRVTQRRLAMALGKHQTFIAKIELGYQEVTLCDAVRIAEMLCVPLSCLLGDAMAAPNDTEMLRDFERRLRREIAAKILDGTDG